MSEEVHGGMPGMTPDSNNVTTSSKDMIMHMSFYWGKDAIIFFSGWPKHSTGMYVLAFLFVFLLAVAVEILSVSPMAKLGKNPFVGALVQSSVYAVRMGFAYMVMLSVMSYNLGFFIAAIAGHALGYFIVTARTLAAASRGDQNGSEPKA